MKVRCLSSLSADSASQLDVLGHDSDTLGMDGAQVGIFEKTDQISFASFLKSHDGRALESEVSLEVLGDLTDQPLEGQLPDEKLGALLVATDLSEGDSSWPVTMGLLDSSSGWGALPGCLGGQLFPWCLSTS
jgi:histone H3